MSSPVENQPSKPIDTPFNTEDTVIDGLPFRQSMCLERPLFPQFVQSTTYTYSYEVYIQGAAAANVISNNIAAQQDIVDTYLNGPLHDIVVRNFMDCNYEQEAEDPTDTSSSYVWVLESSPQEVDTGGRTCRGINTFPSDYACFVVHAFERIYVYDLSSQRKRRQQRRQRLKQRRHLQPTSTTSEEFADRIKNFLQNQMGLGTFNNLATPSYSSTRIVYINGDGGEDGDDDNGSSSSSNYGIAGPTKPPTPTAASIVIAPSPSPTVILSPTIVDAPLDVNWNANGNTLEDNGGSKEGLSVIAFSSLVAAASFVVLLLFGGFVFTRWRRRKQKMESSMGKKSSSSSQAMKQYIQNADLEIIQEVTATMTTMTMDSSSNNNNNNNNILGIDLVRGNTVLTDDITAADKSDESSSSPNSKTSTTSSKKQKRKSSKSYWSL